MMVYFGAEPKHGVAELHHGVEACRETRAECGHRADLGQRFVASPGSVLCARGPRARHSGGMSGDAVYFCSSTIVVAASVCT
jgi:hypothetical protein